MTHTLLTETEAFARLWELIVSDLDALHYWLAFDENLSPLLTLTGRVVEGVLIGVLTTQTEAKEDIEAALESLEESWMALGERYGLLLVVAECEVLVDLNLPDEHALDDLLKTLCDSSFDCG